MDTNAVPEDEEFDFNAALARQLTERQRRARENSNVERLWTRKQIEQAFIETFELIGGIPRLALWANEHQNYGDFLKLLMRLAPKEAQSTEEGGTVLEYRSNVPQSSLNRGKPEAPSLPLLLEGESAVIVDSDNG